MKRYITLSAIMVAGLFMLGQKALAPEKNRADLILTETEKQNCERLIKKNASLTSENQQLRQELNRWRKSAMRRRKRDLFYTIQAVLT